MGAQVAKFPYFLFVVDCFLQVPATTSSLKKIIARVFERTGWDIKETFTSEELADMIDAVVKEPPHMCVFRVFCPSSVPFCCFPLATKLG